MSMLRGYPIEATTGGRAPLTVTDIERLAKSGVAVNFADIALQVVSDPVVSPDYARPTTLVESFWQRWRRANVSDHANVYTMRDESLTFNVFAHEHGDKVYVMVCPVDCEPFILEDVKHLYPSDALMAKLHLREKTK